jgi:hypothetical protein
VLHPFLAKSSSSFSDPVPPSPDKDHKDRLVPPCSSINCFTRDCHRSSAATPVASSIFLLYLQFADRSHKPASLLGAQRPGPRRSSQPDHPSVWSTASQ